MNLEDRKIKFVVLGAGHIGKRHAEMIRRDPEAELIAMVDVRSQEECEVTGFEVPFFNTWEELIASRLDFEVVNVCTPNGFHAQQCLDALEAKNTLYVKNRWDYPRKVANVLFLNHCKYQSKFFV
jgi:UDP-N-acetyl-2-amino-2-deoxyglucuronate dehydrogenase